MKMKYKKKWLEIETENIQETLRRKRTRNRRTKKYVGARKMMYREKWQGKKRR